jgi:CO/xanthine dehydrogenase FAD-binding subunit
VRSFIPGYEMQTPPNLAAALDRLSAESGAWRPFAGGTDLMVLLEAGKLPHKKFLNILPLPELRGIDATACEVSIGALTTYTDVRRHAVLSHEFPLLARAASETGSLATQNRGTVGGNIANGSPAADTPPALLVYDAVLDLISSRGRRSVPYGDFCSGYKQMDLRPDELIERIRLPRGIQRTAQYYRKIGTRRAQAISKVCLAGTAQIRDGRLADIRIALGSVAPMAVRAPQTEALLRGQSLSPSLSSQARESLTREIAPIDDIRSTSDYRLRVAQNLLAEFLESLRT